MIQKKQVTRQRGTNTMAKKTAKPKTTDKPSASDPPKKRGRGRPKGSKNKPKDPTPPPPQPNIFENKSVKQIPLTEIVLDDRTFQFRQSLQDRNLQENIETHGQQIPIILRPHPDQTDMYQVISGFRRLTAIKAIGWTHVDAIVRDDLDDDKKAFHASLIENEARKTYSDVDRGYAVKRYLELGHKYEELEAIFKLGTRQLKRLKKIPDYPKALQDALSDDDSNVKMAHAFILNAFHSDEAYPDFDLKHWLKRQRKEALNRTALQAAIRREIGKDDVFKLFSTQETEDEDGNSTTRYIFPRRHLDLSSMPKADKKALKRDLQSLLKLLG
tara:strand:+ start:709 stop:1695 length:987 start_codon:yes stop_codon:yes gene_type:complete